MTHDKQLRGIALELVTDKRRLDQALNAKEFAVRAGISYSAARMWFGLPGFPVFQGVVFWSDFAKWRTVYLFWPSLPVGLDRSQVNLAKQADSLEPAKTP